MVKKTLLILSLLVAGCARQDNGSHQQQPKAEAPARAPVAAPEPGTPAGLPDERTPLEEPRGPIDPKSAEAAAQVLQHFGAMIEQKRFEEAGALWSDKAAARQFTGLLSGYSEAHLQVGRPGVPEGAAGSIYVTVPVVLYGRRTSGPAASAPADAVLRRVNDVPGSTEQQRRWRIEQINLKSPD
jgi:hypothetical protein